MAYRLSLIIVLVFTSTYSQVVTKNIPEKEKIKSIADSLFLNKNYENAIVMYSKLLLIDGKQETVLFNRGMSYFILKDNSNAVKDFSNLIDANDRNSKAYYFRGLSKFNISSKSDDYDAQTTSTACDDLFMAKELGYEGDYSHFKVVCPDL